MKKFNQGINIESLTIGEYTIWVKNGATIIQWGGAADPQNKSKINL